MNYSFPEEADLERRLGEPAGLPNEKQDKKVRKKALISLMRQQAIRFYKLMRAQKLEAMARQAERLVEAATVAYEGLGKGR